MHGLQKAREHPMDLLVFSEEQSEGLHCTCADWLLLVHCVVLPGQHHVDEAHPMGLTVNVDGQVLLLECRCIDDPLLMRGHPVGYRGTMEGAID